MEEKKVPKKGNKYGSWKPGKKKDNGEYLKKNGRKKGTTLVKQTEVEIEVGTIVNYITFGKAKLTHPDNKKIAPHTPLNVTQACKEYGIAPVTFYQHLKRFPSVNEKYQELKASRREYLKESAEINIQSALTGGMDLSDKEIVDASFKVLEKTDKAYNPKIEIEQKSISINLNKNSDDLYNDIANLIGLDLNG